MAAERLMGTSRRDNRTRIVPDGHVGLFMGTRTQKEA
jgi:hypothetical protein